MMWILGYLVFSLGLTPVIAVAEDSPAAPTAVAPASDSLTDISNHRRTAPGTRPFIFGCGVFWGDWYELPKDQAMTWNTKCFDMLKAMGATNLGVGGSAWCDVEKVRGTYDWSRVDLALDEALKRGFEPFAFTGLTPEWAMPPDVPLEKRKLTHRFPPDEKYAADFERWAQTMAQRYRGKVKYYEFWNEPNGCSWINDGCGNSGMAHTYVPWLKRWYAAMKKGDPNCVLAVGGLDYNSGVHDGWTYLEDIYKCGGGDFFDAVAIHPYGEPLHWAALRDTYACLVRHGQGHKKLWLNEYGWNTRDEDKKARNLAEVLEKLKQPEFHYVFMANYLVLTDLEKNGHDYGLCDLNLDKLEVIPRASYKVFQDFDKKTFPPNCDQPSIESVLPPPPAPPLGPNLLQNANLDLDFERAPEQFQGDPNHVRMKAQYWELIGENWWTRSGGDGHLNHTPFGAQSVSTDWGRIDNAIYQRVMVAKGHQYRFSAWTRGDTPGKTGENLWRAVGIDLAGGANVYGASIVWSTRSYLEETWEQQTVEALAQSDVLTVFIYARTVQPNGWQWFHADTAELVDVTSKFQTFSP